jgi:hypothetical protein
MHSIVEKKRTFVEGIVKIHKMDFTIGKHFSFTT